MTETNKTNQPDELTEVIIEQIKEVRDTGQTNMFSIPGVQRIAYDLGCFELVNFINERKNHKAYINFIMHGKETKA